MKFMLLNTGLLAKYNQVHFFIILWNLIANKKAWETLNVYFSKKLRFEVKIYFCRPVVITMETKMRDKFLTQ